MKRLISLGALTAILLLALTACGGLAAPAQPTATPTPLAAQPVWSQQIHAQTWSTDGGDPAMTASFTLPKIENEGDSPAFAALNQFYADEGVALLENAAEMAAWAIDDCVMATELGEPFTPYTQEQTYALSFQTDSLVSIVRSGYAHSGAPYPDTWVNAETFDLTTGKQMEFKNLFTVLGDEAQSRILTEVQTLAAADAEAQYDAAQVERRFNPQRFYLTDSALVFYFAPYELGPHAVGAPTFPIPYETLEDILISW